MNGRESRVETKILSTFPATVENTVFNNAPGMSFVFDWPGAGLGGFQSFVTLGTGCGHRLALGVLGDRYTPS